MTILPFWLCELTPNRRQAIILTSADPIHWRIYAALQGDELNVSTSLHVINVLDTFFLILGVYNI